MFVQNVFFFFSVDVMTWVCFVMDLNKFDTVLQDYNFVIWQKKKYLSFRDHDQNSITLKCVF